MDGNNGQIVKDVPIEFPESPTPSKECIKEEANADSPTGPNSRITIKPLNPPSEFDKAQDYTISVVVETKGETDNPDVSHQDSPTCSYSFAHISNLKTSDNLQSDDSKKFTCAVCGKGFKDTSKLKMHEMIHSDVKPYKCSYCEKGFIQKGNLKTHERLHTGDKPFKCKICDKSFTQKGNLKTHEVVHTDNHPFKCTICGKGFKQNVHLKLHSTVHTCNIKSENPDGKVDITSCGDNIIDVKKFEFDYSDGKRHRCSLCGRGFKFRGDMLKHEKTHTNEKPFKCQFCNKFFPTAGNLKRHEMIHNDIKPYKCSFCNKSFVQGGNLKIHERIHTGEKPYKCETCNKCFSQRNQLKSHMMVHVVSVNIEITEEKTEETKNTNEEDKKVLINPV